MKKLLGMLIAIIALGTTVKANIIDPNLLKPSSFVAPNSIKITNKSGKDLTVTRFASGGIFGFVKSVQKGQNPTRNFTIKDGKSRSLSLRNYNPYGGPVMAYEYRQNYRYQVSQSNRKVNIDSSRGNIVTVGPKLNLSYSNKRTAPYDGGIMPMSTALGVSARPMEGTALIPGARITTEL